RTLRVLANLTLATIDLITKARTYFAWERPATPPHACYQVNLYCPRIMPSLLYKINHCQARSRGESIE
ncbi:MAG: hypothetical protein WCF08_01750, partial [Anaerolineaceae bacterium]